MRRLRLAGSDERPGQDHPGLRPSGFEGDEPWDGYVDDELEFRARYTAGRGWTVNVNAC